MYASATSLRTVSSSRVPDTRALKMECYSNLTNEFKRMNAAFTGGRIGAGVRKAGPASLSAAENNRVEAGVGIEPASTALQAAAA